MTRTARVVLDDIDGYFGPVAVEVRTYLGGRGVRVTPSRIAVVAALSGGLSPRHVSAQQLLRDVATTPVHLDATTLYRTLVKLEGLSFVHRVAIPDRATLYGLDDPAHHHAICTACRQLQTIPLAVLAPLAVAAGRAAAYEVAPSFGSVTLQGVCAGCSDDRTRSTPGRALPPGDAGGHARRQEPVQVNVVQAFSRTST